MTANKFSKVPEDSRKRSRKLERGVMCGKLIGEENRSSIVDCWAAIMEFTSSN